MAGVRHEIIQAVEACSSCGACQAVCPVYRATRREEASARAKIRMAGALARGQLQANAAIRHMLSACLLCGRCAQACPNQVDARKAQEQARVLAGDGLQQKIVEAAISRPGRLDALIKALRLALPGESGLLLRLTNLEGLNKLPKPAKTPFLHQIPEIIQGPVNAPRVAFFVGCLANYLRPELAQKAVDLLARSYTVVVPPDQGCCGLMARSAGAQDTAAELNRRNQDALLKTGADMVVTACSSCAYALQSLALPPVREICQVLAAQPDGLASAARERVLLHTPCHQAIGLNAPGEPRQMLEAAGVPMADAPDADQCCGGGGLFAPANVELSREIFGPRLREMVQSGADTLATTCSGCFIQWRRGLPPGKRVCHPLELLE